MNSIKALYHLYASLFWSTAGYFAPSREDFIDRADVHWTLGEDLMDALENSRYDIGD